MLLLLLYSFFVLLTSLCQFSQLMHVLNWEGDEVTLELITDKEYNY
jgi:hypothetical protein